MNILTRLIRNRLGLPLLNSLPLISFSTQTIPELVRKPDEILVKQWWSQTRIVKIIKFLLLFIFFLPYFGILLVEINKKMLLDNLL
jgi:hypothetical protein